MTPDMPSPYKLPEQRAPIDASAAEQARRALEALSLEGKIALLAGNGTMTLAANPAIGLTEEFWFSDGPHTVRPELERNNFNSANRNDDHSTVLPTLSALAATWDTDLARQFGEVLGREARSRGKDVLLGPGMNLQRTPLNGRNYEYLGEDPHLASRIAVEYVRGLQSKDVAACVKHFACNDQELERGSVDVIVDEQTLRELYLLPFEAAIIEAEALTVMNGYNRFRGEFCSHNAYLNHEVLKDGWGFPGFVVSDWGGIHDTVGGALGGVDVEMHAGEAIRHFKGLLLEAIRDGRVPEKVVDAMALRVLYVMAKIGKLGGRTRAEGARNTPEHQAFARTVAENAIVLLRNELGVLPLRAEHVSRLLLIGTNGDAVHAAGGWSAEGKPPYEITPLKGLRTLLGDRTEVTFIAGPFTEKFVPVPESVLQTIDTSDLNQGAAQKGWHVALLGTDATAAPKQTFARTMDARNSAFAKASAGLKPLREARWTTEFLAPETGTYRFSLQHDGSARLLLDGAPLLETESSERPVIRYAAIELPAGRRCTLQVEWTPGSNATTCELLWLSPSMTPISPGQLAEESKRHDAVVFLTGNLLGHGRARECEGADRPDLALPEGDDEAIAAVLAARPDTVVVVQSGSPVSMPWIRSARTLVHYWFSGMEGGNALARVLFGRVTPSGKLPFTVPKRLEDTGSHALGAYGPVRVEYLERLTMGYRWHDAREIDPLFPFGHGLSYTTFHMGTPEPEHTDVAAGKTLRVSVEVSNRGQVEGQEVVQLYVGSSSADQECPPRELRAFRKVNLLPGETARVELELPARAFAKWDDRSRSWVVQPGDYTLSAGSSSRSLSNPVVVRITAPTGSLA